MSKYRKWYRRYFYDRFFSILRYRYFLTDLIKIVQLTLIPSPIRCCARDGRKLVASKWHGDPIGMPLYCYTNGAARHAAGITHATETAFDYASNCSRPSPLWRSACILLLLRLLYAGYPRGRSLDARYIRRRV